jgi:tyrosine-protein phosphatase SIW14
MNLVYSSDPTRVKLLGSTHAQLGCDNLRASRPGQFDTLRAFFSSIPEERCSMPIHGRLSRTLAAIALLTFSFAWPATGQNDDSQTRAITNVGASHIRIDNFGRVSDRYYRGAQPMGHDYVDLAALGVKTVINLTGDDAQANERELVEEAGMRYLQIPMTTRTSPTPEQLAQFLAIVNDSESSPVYVHCVGGKHRTGVMTATYRMTYDGWTADQAFREMKNYKFGADFLHPEFKQFVYAFNPRPQSAPVKVILATSVPQ